MADNKTLEVKLRFWTNDVPKTNTRGETLKICWDHGVVAIPSNNLFGIEKGSHAPFNCLDDIIPAIKELLRKNNVYSISGNRRPRIMNPNRRSK